MKKVVYFIMAGGEGMRLWPMSRSSFPKQLHQVLGERSLLQQSLQRIMAVGGKAENILIGTREDLYFFVKEQWQELKLKSYPCLILEPLSRNTAPAIELAILACRKRFGEDVILVTLAADHLIKEQKRFATLLKTGIKIAEQGNIVTFGIVPAYAETGYGYIKIGEEMEKDVFKALQFKEKPTPELANKYIRNGAYLWNSGMFIFDTKIVSDALKKFVPDVVKITRQLWERRKEKEDCVAFDKKLFSRLPNISIDYAVMEKAEKIAVIKADFNWCDVGCWRMVHELSNKDKSGNVFSGDVFSVDTKNTFVRTEKRFVATVGLRDLIVIDTPDALLISDKDRTQDVKKIVEELNAKGSTLTKFHATVYRPWGNFTVLEEGPGYKIKRVVVNPKQQLSLQKHNYRSEHWVVVSGSARMIKGYDSIFLKANESLFIPANCKHRIINPNNKDLVIIEVQTGGLISEDDIVRYADVYERI